MHESQHRFGSSSPGGEGTGINGKVVIIDKGDASAGMLHRKGFDGGREKPISKLVQAALGTYRVDGATDDISAKALTPPMSPRPLTQQSL